MDPGTSTKQNNKRSLDDASDAVGNEKIKIEVPLLNPMVFYARFSHISEDIFKKMDSKSLKNCREVSKPWQECIDNQDILWNKIAKKENGGEAFELACTSGHSKMAKVLIQKSAELNIDLDHKDWLGETAFQNVCEYGNSKIAEMLIQKSTDFNIDLNAKDKYGMTGFHIACKFGSSKVAKMLIQTSTEFNIDLNAKDEDGKTAFHFACSYGNTSTIEMMINSVEYFKLDLTAKDNLGQTGFQTAKRLGHTNVVNLIREKMPEIAVIH